MTSHPDPGKFRRAVSRFVTGVTVVTSLDRSGSKIGMTANSFTSISLSPPMVLVSVKQGRTLEAVRHTGKLGINVLPASAKELSSHFAGRPISGLEPAFEQAGDMPKLARAIAYFSCDLERVIEVADHTLLIGAVRECSYQDEAEPLVFFSSEYRELVT